MGYKHTEEAKKKIGLAKRGALNPMKNEAARLKMIASKKGVPLSEEQKKKISKSCKKNGVGKWMKGKKASPETRRKLTQMRLGAGSHFWKGGKTKVAILVRACVRYKDWRVAILERDDYTCKLCFKRGGSLVVDHFPTPLYLLLEVYSIQSLPDALSCEPLWSLDNGRTLCKPCHTVETSVLLRRKIPTYGNAA